MKFHYINHNNRKVDLSSMPYILEEADILDWIYSYETKTKIKNETVGYKKDVAKFKAKIAIVIENSITHQERKNHWKSAMNDLTEVFEEDVSNGVNGKLYSDTGYYLPCKIIGSEKNERYDNVPIVSCTFTILADNPVWIKEETKQFFATTSNMAAELTGDLDYPYNYPYDYAPSAGGLEIWTVNHYANSEFKMTIYGPCENPRIMVGDYPYEVFTFLDRGEYIVIDSASNKVTKYLVNGATVDLFDYRGKIKSVFEPMPAGNLIFSWPGTYGFDVTLYTERSEPKW